MSQEPTEPTEATELKRDSSLSVSGKTFERKNLWSCCGNKRIDRRFVVLGAQAFFSILVLIFCCSEIRRDPDSCTNTLLSWHCSIIGIIVHAWVQKNLLKEDTP